jgi:hypothetical protein
MNKKREMICENHLSFTVPRLDQPSHALPGIALPSQVITILLETD